MLRPRKKPNLLTYLRLKDFAASAGVTERAVHAWLAKPKLDPEVKADLEEHLGTAIPSPADSTFKAFLKTLKKTHPAAFRRLKSNRTKCLSYGIVYKGKAYISLQGAERFLTQRNLQRTPHRPKGWLTVAAATEVTAHSKWKLYKAIFSGKLNAVIHSQTIYIEPESLKRFKLEQRSLLPLPGWIMVKEGADISNRSYTSLNAWLKLHNKETRVFLHPILNRPCRYMLRADLESYKGQTEKTAKHIPKVFR